MAKYAAPKSMDQKMVAEFLGTFLLVFTWCSQSMAGGILGAFAVASILMCGVYSLGGVSGANFNPAVSLGLRLAAKMGHGDFSLADMGLYWCAQLAGGALGAVSSGYVFQSVVGGPSSWVQKHNISSVLDHEGTFDPVGMNALGAGPGFDMWSVLLAEMIYTAVLVLVVLNVATCNDQGSGAKNHYFGLAIGFVIVAGAVSIGYITQCSLNPAVSLGVTVGSLIFGTSEVAVGSAMQTLAVYVSGELLGAVLAAGLFFVLRKYMIDCEGEPEAPALSSKLTAEFVGTFVLVLTVSLVVQAPQSSPIGVVGIASSLMVMIYALGAVSGANFNPAVSVGVLMAKGLTGREFAFYVISQLAGGVAAVLTASLLLRDWSAALVGPNVHPVIAQGSWGMIAGSEIMYTFVLVFVVLQVAVGPDAPNQYYGLAIGFVIIAGGVAVGKLSGGMFNPAVAVAMDFGTFLQRQFHEKEGSLGGSLAYSGFEVIGAVLAAGLFQFFNRDDKHEETTDGEDGEESYEEELVVAGYA